MQSIQTCLVELISVCLKELKAANPLLDADELTPENALTKSFDFLVKLYVDPVMHTLSFKSRQLLADIRWVLCLLLMCDLCARSNFLTCSLLKPDVLIFI